MGNSLQMPLEGKAVIFKQEGLTVLAEENPFLVTGGFGALPFTRGTALMGTFLSDGEQARMGGWMVERLATAEEVEAAGQLASAILEEEGVSVEDATTAPGG